MSRRPPRLLVKTMAVTFVTVALLVVLVLIVVMVTVRNQVRQSVIDNLEAGQRVFAALEARRQRELRAQVASLAENPTLKAALDTYQAELKASDALIRAQLVATITRELEKLTQPIECDAIVLVDPLRRVLASAGPLAAEWRPGRDVAFIASPGSSGFFDGVVHAGAAAFRAVSVPIVADGDVVIGNLYVMTSLDERFAKELASLARTRTAIVSNGLLVASTLAPAAAQQFEATVGRLPATGGTVQLSGETYAFRRLIHVGDADFYGLGSIDESAQAPMRSAMWSLTYLAVGATLLAFVASFWLARMLTEPIGELSASLIGMRESHSLTSRLPASGSSRELDALTGTFNALMESVTQAEAQTQSAYTGAIRALATALDARDPYTAGHSDRVSVLSVAIGRELHLSDEQIEILRLGALLHDIGKIGVPDAILMKAGPLTDEERARIQLHPGLGARILKSVPFLAPHIPIVELHHERPDGRGYPHGLRGDDIPMAARIVHVADAYDAITSARAYRVARPSGDAMQELWRCAGTEYHADIVGALATALPGVTFEVGKAVDEPVSA